MDVKEDKSYQEIYGVSAHQTKEHSESYGCFKQNVIGLNNVTDITLQALKKVEEIRTSSFITRRRKRATTFTATTVVAVISLLSSLGSSIYFEYKISDLNRYIDQITLQLQNDDKYEKTIAENVKLLYNDSTVTAMRSNVLLKRLKKYKNVNACSFGNIFLRQEQNRLGQKLHDISTDLTVGRLTPNLLPVEDLKALIDASSILRGSVYKEDPLIMYRISSVSLLHVDTEKRKISFILAFPLVNGDPSFVRLNPLIPTTTLKTSTNHYHRFFTRLPATVALDIQSLKTINFNLSKLGAYDFQNARLTLDCTTLSQREVCKNLPYVDQSTAFCLKGMITGNVSLQMNCPSEERKVDGHDLSTVVQGENGLLVSSALRPNVYGVTHKKRDLIAATHEKSGLGICLFVPNSYDEVEVEIRGKISKFTQNQIYRFHHRVVETPESGPSLINWYNTSLFADDVIDSLRPITMTEIKEMVKSNADLHLVGSRYGHLESLVIVALLLVLGVMVLLAFWSRSKFAPWANSAAFSSQTAYQSFRMSDMRERTEMRAGIDGLRQELLQSRADMVFLEDRLRKVEAKTKDKGGLLPFPREKAATVDDRRKTNDDFPLPNV